jgi:hypothetical protein
MITRFARIIKASAFSAMLAYVLVLNVLLAGFAQAAILDHALNNGSAICTTAGDETPKDKRLAHQCPMCCLAVQSHSTLPPVYADFIERFSTISELLLAADDTLIREPSRQITKARAPPFS